MWLVPVQKLTTVWKQIPPTSSHYLCTEDKSYIYSHFCLLKRLQPGLRFLINKSLLDLQSFKEQNGSRHTFVVSLISHFFYHSEVTLSLNRTVCWLLDSILILVTNTSTNANHHIFICLSVLSGTFSIRILWQLHLMKQYLTAAVFFVD